jgi:Protein of unknown function (DUF3352)
MSALGRVPRAIGRGLHEFWAELTGRTRQRLVLAVLGAGAAVLLLALVVPALPCQLPGGDACPPPDDAEELVPAGALAYVHLSLDPDSEQYELAAGSAEELPGLSRQLIDRLLAQVPGPGGRPADFGTDIAPWFGGEAAAAVVPAGGGGEYVAVLEEGDAELAAAYAESIAAGEAQVAEYEGVELRTDERGLATASVEGFLLIGAGDGVRALIDVSAGVDGARALADDPIAEAVRDELPPERFADAYFSEGGIEQLISTPDAPLASLEPFVDATASGGAAASLGAGEETFEVAIRSSLDPERAGTTPGFFSAFPSFEPQLPDRLAADSLGYVGLADPGTTVSELLAQATAEAPALAEGFASAARRLRDLGGVDISGELLPALGGEAAFALQPGPEGEPAAEDAPTTTTPPTVPEGLPSGEPPIATESPVPVLQFLAEGVDADRAGEAMARLQGPISEAFDPETTLRAPVFERRDVDGVEVNVLALSPTVELSYAVAGEGLVIATQPEGVEQVIRGEGGLADSAGFERATEGFPDELSLLAYLDLEGLIRLGEREGLAEDPAYAAFAEELGRLEALGVAVEAGEEALATDLRLTIGPADEGDSAASDQPAD